MLLAKASGTCTAVEAPASRLTDNYLFLRIIVMALWRMLTSYIVAVLLSAFCTLGDASVAKEALSPQQLPIKGLSL